MVINWRYFWVESVEKVTLFVLEGLALFCLQFLAKIIIKRGCRLHLCIDNAFDFFGFLSQEFLIIPHFLKFINPQN